MAVQNKGLDLTMPASADASAWKYRFVLKDTNGRGTLAGSAGKAIGLQQNSPSAQGEAMAYRSSGVSKMVAGGVLNEGDFIQSNAQGFGTAAAGVADRVVAQALMACGGSGDIVDVILRPGFINAS